MFCNVILFSYLCKSKHRRTSNMIKDRIISALLATMLILIFQPWGLSQFGWMRFVLIAGIGVYNVVFCILSEYIVRHVFRMSNNPDLGYKFIFRRNIYYQIINIVICTAGTAFYLDRFATNEVVDNHLCWENTCIIFAVVVGTTFLVGLYWRNVFMKRHYQHELEDAQRLNGILQERNRLSASASGTISGDSVLSDSRLVNIECSTRESLRLKLSDFIYAESGGNYVSIYHLQEGKMQKNVLRVSLKNIIPVLCSIPSIVQCHRTFIVNLRYLEKAEGRMGGICLAISHTSSPIPVSKTYVQEVKERIQNPG